MLGLDVVERELPGMGPAVLAGELVAQEHLAAGQANPRSRPLDEVVQANHRGHSERARRRPEDEAIDLEYFGLAAVDKDERSSWVTHVERLIVLIQNEHLPHVSSRPLPAAGLARI